MLFRRLTSVIAIMVILAGSTFYPLTASAQTVDQTSIDTQSSQSAQLESADPQPNTNTSTTDNQTYTLEGTITKVIEQRQDQAAGGNVQLYQKLQVTITAPQSQKGQSITIENGTFGAANVQQYVAGDNVQILASTTPDGQVIYQISDYIRRTPLLWLTIIFAGLILLINFRKGLYSLVSLVLTFVVIFAIVLPLILNGVNPVLVCLVAAFILIPLTYFISHGINRKTIVAALGTFLSLIISVILAHIFIEATKLTGYASDEAAFLQAAKQGTINIHGLILAGVVLGLIGVLDDVTITQTGFINQLKHAQPAISGKELFSRGMSVGRDHISSLVNTLVLVYTSAAMPLLLLFNHTGRPFFEIINYEIVAEEIVRTLIVSIGIVLSVPVTTYVAAKTIDWPLWQHPFFNRFGHSEEHHHH